MDLGLKNAVALISGSSRGLGVFIAEAFLEEGAKVCLTARNPETLSATEHRLRDKFGTDAVSSLCADLETEEGCSTVKSFLENKFEKLDALIANVGNGKGKLGLSPDRKDWIDSLSLNLVSPALLVSSCYSLLAASKGSIVVISSIAGKETIPAPVPYSASKQALSALTKNYSRLMAKDGIRINMVCPGNILLSGGVWERKLEQNKQSVESYIASEVPLKRFATGREIADAVIFLSSYRAAFITGSSLVIDGGQTRSF